MSYAFRAEGVRKCFGRRQVLTNAGFWGERGKITVLMGSNGAGKTTLLRIAVGELFAEQGVISFGGYVGERPRLAELATRGLFWVPQEQLLSPSYTVSEHLQAVETRFGLKRDMDTVEVLGLTGLLGTRARDLSGGERMKASVALAATRRPTCLLIDEPFARVAPKDQDVMAAVLRRLAQDGTAVITSGHDVPVLFGLSDSVIWCVAGTTHALGTPEQALQHDHFAEEYLGPRYRGSSRGGLGAATVS
jgi:ABC-type multidrug transport system ATPase subunit